MGTWEMNTSVRREPREVWRAREWSPTSPTVHSAMLGFAMYVLN